MSKAVFFDIDGTIWDEHMRIPQSAKEAVRALRAAGHYAFLCSGRSRCCIRNRELLGIGFDGVVASCGMHVDFRGETILERLMTQEQVRGALAALDLHKMLAVLEGPRHIYVDAETFTDDPYVIYLREELGDEVLEISGTSSFEVNKLSADLKGAPLGPVLRSFSDEFNVIVHNEWLLEIMPKGYSKATGIREVCERLGIAREDTYAFGDSANDLEMLGYVAHGVAMGNATKEVKDAAEYVTGPVMGGGIINGLSHYGLIG